ncbi:hypothetical protein MMC17_008531 [Xylographa soralifera]|nr:hypothetical protein [Xylographa soralifera]
MEKITDKIAALPPHGTYFSLEFFPPKTDMGTSNLQARLSRMSRALHPLFITITWGAGGSTSSRSLELAEICQRQLGLTTCLHLTCTNTNQRVVDEALKAAKDIGVRNILALRGDPPREHEYRSEEQEMEGAEKFVWAADLVLYIRRTHGDYFCIGVAGYPEGHSDESCPIDQDPVHDMPYLVEKVQAGADFIMTQLFYDVDAYLSYVDLVRNYREGVLGTIPIIPGLMPIQNYQILKRTTKLSHAKLPNRILQRLEEIKGDDEEVKRVGVEIISEIVDELKRVTVIGPRGYHFYTLNLEKAVSFILERCHLIPSSTPDIDEYSSSAIDDTEVPPTNGEHVTHLVTGLSRRNQVSVRRLSSPHNHVIPLDRSPTLNPSALLDASSRAITLAISHGVGSLGREATWDDYPNGRFGDARSPAFGEIDGYGGPSLHHSPSTARTKWGSPESRSDISDLFKRHVMGSLDQLPWSEGSLNEETRVIKHELCRLIEERGWWSIASQPAVDGVSSDDPIFGWGPKGGFVFQKAFVEFFIPEKDWKTIVRPYLNSTVVAPDVSWYAAPCPSSTVTENNSFESSDPASAVNSVTWGVFPGKEIVTPTIVEEVSFRAWVDEAFGIWAEWEHCYAPESRSRCLLQEERERCWLVNVICHDFRQKNRLWEILLSA